MVRLITLVRSAIHHLTGLGANEELCPFYLTDRPALDRLDAIPDWSPDDQRVALLLFAKYRRLLIRNGFDYHTIFPKNKDNHDLVARIKKVYEHADYLVKTHNIRPPRGFDLMPLESVDQWVRDKIIEARVMNARRLMV